MLLFSCPYSYSRSDVIDMGTDIAIMLGLRNDDGSRLSNSWFTGFKARHNLKLRKPVPLSIIRAQGMNHEAIARYFNALKVQYVKDHLSIFYVALFDKSNPVGWLLYVWNYKPFQSI